MDSPPPPDPYEALGLKKDCTLTEIRKAHRSLVLKAHPDKFLDPVVKAQKADEFTKIQQAYELLCDDERRRNYDDRQRLAELRREMMERRAKQAGDGLNVKTGTKANSSAYTTRTAAPSFAAASPKPSHPVYEEEDVRTSSRKHDSYERIPRATKTASKPSTTERLRSEKEKERDRAKRSERASKKAYDDSDSDEKRAYEEKRERKRREDDRYARDEPKRSSRDDDHYAPKVQNLTEEAKRYMGKTSSSREHRSERPAPAHRSSSYRAEPSRDDVAYAVRSSSSSKYKSQEKGARRYQEIVEEPVEERRKPSLNKSQSSPADIDISNLRASGRAQTYSYPERDRDTSPPKPSFKRSQTERVDRHREEEPSARHSKKSSYRYGEREDSGYSSSGTPENRQSQWSNTTTAVPSSKPSKSHTTPVIPEEEALPRATFKENIRPQPQPQQYTQASPHAQYYETRAPSGSSKRYTSSPERIPVDPRSIPIVEPRGVEQPSRSERKIQYSYSRPHPETSSTRPSLQPSQTYTAVPNIHSSSSNPARLFGEVRSGGSRDEGRTRERDPRDRAQYGEVNVAYAPRYGHEDVAYSRGGPGGDRSSRGYERERGHGHAAHPGLERRHTSQVNAAYG